MMIGRNTYKLIVFLILLSSLSIYFGLNIYKKSKAVEQLALDIAAGDQMLKLDPNFSDHMVIQRSVPFKIFGTAKSYSPVNVKLGTHISNTTTLANGKWEANFSGLPAGGPFYLTASSGTSRVVLSDINLGDVFLCSGQSNMSMTLAQSTGGSNAISRISQSGMKIKFLRINRYLKLPKDNSPIPRSVWFNASDTINLTNFSAVCALTGEQIASHIKIPVGLVEAAVGGSTIEAWISVNRLQTYTPALPIINALNLANTFSEIPVDLRACKDWGNSLVLYNGMIAGLKSMRFKALIWYQGESNASRALEYKTLLSKLISNFRGQFLSNDLPVFLVQLPSYKFGNYWQELRWAQSEVSKSLINISLIPSYDLPGADSIHPPDKRPLAERLYKAIASKFYNANLVAYGPKFVSQTIQGNSIIVKFGDVNGMLMTADDQRPNSFLISAANGIFYPANAEISALDSVKISNSNVAEPKFVRYAWSQDAAGANLINSGKWPAIPFRTDNFTLQTASSNLSNRPLCPSSLSSDPATMETD